MNDSLKMFLIALVTTVASQLLLGPYIARLQGIGPVSAPPHQEHSAKLERGPTPLEVPTPSSRLNAPNLEGMSVAAASERWRDKGLTIIEDGERIDSGAEPGTIIAQRPAPGSSLASLEIRVTVAKTSPETKGPSVVGRPIDEARRALEDAGFQVSKPTLESSREPKGTVIRQNPAADRKVRADSLVRLVVAEPAKIVVPKLVGTRMPRARQLLEDAGLVLGTVRRVEHEERRQDTVLRQDPEPDAEVPPGTEIELVIVAPD